MEQTAVQKLARALRVLVTLTFICNLALLPLVPGLVFARDAYRGAVLMSALRPDGRYYFLAMWADVWANPYTGVLAAFLLFCGGCTAVILWQGRRALGTILAGDPFRLENARAMRRASVCCFLIAAAALARMVWGLFCYGSPAPLFTYNALFVPIFLMGGLLCQVMSALFRQAAELKADSDLTI